MSDRDHERTTDSAGSQQTAQTQQGSTRGGGQQAQGGGQGRARAQGGPQPTGGHPGYGGGTTVSPDFARFGKLAVASYLTVGLGLMLSIFLASALGEGGLFSIAGGGMGGAMAEDASLFVAAFGSISYVAILAALLALGIGFYVAKNATGQTSPPVASAAVNAAGLAVTELLLVILAALFAPGGGFDIGSLIAPVIGLVIGVAAMGGAAGAIAERVPTW